jgi:hypothetical protein
MLTVGRTGDPPAPTDAEVRLLSDIGRRVGLVLDNARLYREQRNVAETLQRQLLSPLPQVNHIRMAARYLPAQSAMQVGGDWYDAFLLRDGVVAVVIGDVVGHDLKAAAHMAEVRNMLRALAWDHQKPPSVIMSRLDEAVTYTSDAPMATLVFARIEGPEGGPWRLNWVNAGHPPPLLVTREGHTRFLTGGHGPLIGMSAALHLGLSWPDADEPLPPECTLVSTPTAWWRAGAAPSTRGWPSCATTRQCWPGGCGTPPWTTSATSCCSGCVRARTTRLCSRCGCRRAVRGRRGIRIPSRRRRRRAVRPRRTVRHPVPPRKTLL